MAASVSDEPGEAQYLREEFSKAISSMDAWIQCIMLDLYDEVLRLCPQKLPDQLVFYMLCCHSQAGTTEHGFGRLEPELLKPQVALVG